MSLASIRGIPHESVAATDWENTGGFNEFTQKTGNYWKYWDKNVIESAWQCKVLNFKRVGVYNKKKISWDKV